MTMSSLFQYKDHLSMVKEFPLWDRFIFIVYRNGNSYTGKTKSLKNVPLIFITLVMGILMLG